MSSPFFRNLTVDETIARAFNLQQRKNYTAALSLVASQLSKHPQHAALKKLQQTIKEQQQEHRTALAQVSLVKPK